MGKSITTKIVLSMLIACCIASFVPQVEADVAVKSEAHKKTGVADRNKSQKAAVVFYDGSVITEDEVRQEMDEIPEAMTARMSLADLKRMISFKLAQKKAMESVIKLSGIGKKPEIAAAIEARKRTFACFSLLEKMALERMDKKSLQKHYDE
jgi:hypothetical protein